MVTKAAYVIAVKVGFGLLKAFQLPGHGSQVLMLTFNQGIRGRCGNLKYLATKGVSNLSFHLMLKLPLCYNPKGYVSGTPFSFFR